MKDETIFKILKNFPLRARTRAREITVRRLEV